MAQASEVPLIYLHSDFAIVPSLGPGHREGYGL